METRAHHVLIGLFTIAGAAAILLFVLWLSKTGIDRDYRLYDIVFNERVSGLSAGSPVQYSGIRVGEVESLRLDSDNPGQVWARVRVASSAPVKTDTTARLTLINITGAYGIELSAGSPDSPRLAEETEGIPVIEAEPSPMALLRLNSEELLVGLTSLMDSANRVLSQDNTRHLARVMTNLDTITTELVGQQDAVREGIRSLTEAGDNLNTLLVRLDDQAERHGEPLLTDAAAAMDNLERLSQRLNDLLTENRQAFDTGMQGIAELGPVVSELRRTLETVGRIAGRMEDDPGGFLLGRDQIREFNP